MILLCLLGVLGRVSAEDTFTLTVVFQRMHCEECKREAEAAFRRFPGFVGVTFSENSAVVSLAEHSPVPPVKGLPKDMGFRLVKLAIRGTVSFSGEKATLVAKGSGTAFALSGEKLGELRKKIGGKNRFQVTGSVSGRSLVIESFQTAEWKD